MNKKSKIVLQKFGTNNESVDGIKVKLCTYIVKNDVGLAPNPFWDICTLALCAPNHCGARLEKGDWIAGFSTKDRGNKLIYAMQIDNKIGFDEYYRDPKYENKKPARNNSKKLCGDNMYFKEAYKWKRHEPIIYHGGKNFFDQDTKNPYVFIGKHFYYFGKAAKQVPDRFRCLIWSRCGITYNEAYPLETLEFISWVSDFLEGIHADPWDWKMTELPADIAT